jgi:VPDSG-CTERM motif
MSSLCRPVAANNAADISWNLTGSGFDLLAVYVFGGSNGANLYKVADAAQMLVGSATVHTPLTGGSGKYATISHILFLGTPGGATVPEGGSAVALLALSVAALAIVRRKVCA